MKRRRLWSMFGRSFQLHYSPLCTNDSQIPLAYDNQPSTLQEADLLTNYRMLDAVQQDRVSNLVQALIDNAAVLDD